ncbi:MAG: cox cluster protein [Haloferacaceae archaeon]|jgi:hypothetical protein
MGSARTLGARASGVHHVFVAVGFAGSEVGLVLGVPSVAVAGLLLFGWSLAGLLAESGVVSRARWRAVVGVVAAAYLAGGAGLWVAELGASRGTAVLGAGVGLCALVGATAVRSL